MCASSSIKNKQRKNSYTADSNSSNTNLPKQSILLTLYCDITDEVYHESFTIRSNALKEHQRSVHWFSKFVHLIDMKQFSKTTPYTSLSARVLWSTRHENRQFSSYIMGNRNCLQEVCHAGYRIYFTNSYSFNFKKHLSREKLSMWHQTGFSCVFTVSIINLLTLNWKKHYSYKEIGYSICNILSKNNQAQQLVFFFLL